MAERPPSLATFAGDPPRCRSKVDALLSVSVFSTEMKSTTISPMVSTSSGSVSGAITIQSNQRSGPAPILALAADTFAPQRLAQGAEHAGELPTVFLFQLREQLGHGGAVFVVDTVHGPLAPPGHLYDGGPPVRGVGLPPDQPFIFQRVDQRRDVAPGNPELVADAAHDLGPVAMQSPEQPHPGVRHPPVLQPRPDPLHVQRPECGELVDEPQRRSLNHRFSIHSTLDPPRTRSIVS